MQGITTPPKAPEGRSPRPRRDGRGPLSSRNSSVLAALVTAALAALVIIAFLNQYRDSVNKDGVPTPVLVAAKPIEKGASADAIGAGALYRTEQIPRDQLKEDAINDASQLKGKVAAADILPGQQLTAGSFAASNRPIKDKLGPDDRAMRVAVDAEHGMTGEVRRGDRVDIYAGFLVNTGDARQRPVLRTVMQDVLVLDAPPLAASSGEGGIVSGAAKEKEVTLKVTSRQGPKLAFAAENGEVWLALRPQNGRSLEEQQMVTLERLLLNVKTTQGGASR